MAVPLFKVDCLAAIEQLRAIRDELKRAKEALPENKDVFDLPDGPKIPLLFDSMPPWAFSGNSTQSSDVGGTQTNEAIEQGRKRQERAAKSARAYYERMKRDAVKWKQFVIALIQQSASANKKLAYQARILIAQLRQWGLL